MIRKILGFAVVLMVAGVILQPATASAQAGDNSAFVGQWELPLSVQGQSFTLDINIMDHDGHLMGTVKNSMGGETEVESFSRSENSLTLEYEVDMQGQTAPIAIRLTPSDADLDATLDVADGMMTLDGKATRK